MATATEELKAACLKSKSPTAEEMLEVGECVWLLGHPSPAEKGNIALEVGPGLRVVMRQQDVVETSKEELGTWSESARVVPSFAGSSRLAESAT